VTQWARPVNPVTQPDEASPASDPLLWLTDDPAQTGQRADNPAQLNWPSIVDNYWWTHWPVDWWPSWPNWTQARPRTQSQWWTRTSPAQAQWQANPDHWRTIVTDGRMAHYYWMVLIIDWLTADIIIVDSYCVCDYCYWTQLLVIGNWLLLLTQYWPRPNWWRAQWQLTNCYWWPVVVWRLTQTQLWRLDDIDDSIDYWWPIGQTVDPDYYCWPNDRQTIIDPVWSDPAQTEPAQPMTDGWPMVLLLLLLLLLLLDIGWWLLVDIVGPNDPVIIVWHYCVVIVIGNYCDWLTQLVMTWPRPVGPAMVENC